VKIAQATARVEAFGLVRPYTIALRHVGTVENVIVQLQTASGLLGLGAASAAADVTGESDQACREALLGGAIGWLVGEDVRELPKLCRQLGERMAGRPAARAAVDIALHDLLAQHLGVPLVAMLGRVHTGLPTSITIGIKPLDETLAEAREYLGRGFRILKVKTGLDLEGDIERLARLREQVGDAVHLRVDPNQGYSVAEVEQFVRRTAHLFLEFLEQPIPAGDIAALRALPPDIRIRIAADESLLDERDALKLLTPSPACGIFNIKLMKCGGIRPALAIAGLAQIAGIELMWGCMDESIVSITAALHAALACPATRYLDLDGSLDLVRDVVTGGFVLKDGYLSTREAPGLGVQLLS
jgi:L-alanine-DL-glutamate epimerase-like enolase superfamily enzyme